MKKETPIAKIYEAVSAIADSRVKEKEDVFLVCSSDYSKAYTVKADKDLYSSNDNATLWQHYAGYPIVAVLIYQKRLHTDPSIYPYFKGIPWKRLNTKYKNKYDLSIEEVFQNLDEDTKEKIHTAMMDLSNQLNILSLTIKGNRAPLLDPKTL